jgi:uncharacterized cupin superfamily protein
MDGDATSEIPVKLNPMDLTPRIGTTAYPPDLRAACDGREKRALGDAFGLSQYGINHTVLRPGAASALRHWHSEEDEFIYVLSGELTLVTDMGETPLTAGECAGFPAGRPDGHMVVNKSAEPAAYLEIGTRSRTDTGTYPDDDLHAVKTDGKYSFFRKDGSPA